jgi:hypothetical protein
MRRVLYMQTIVKCGRLQQNAANYQYQNAANGEIREVLEIRRIKGPYPKNAARLRLRQR